MFQIICKQNHEIKNGHIQGYYCVFAMNSGPVSVCNGQYAAFQTEQCLYAALLVRQNLGTCVFIAFFVLEMPQCKL